MGEGPRCASTWHGQVAADAQRFDDLAEPFVLGEVAPDQDGQSSVWLRGRCQVVEGCRGIAEEHRPGPAHDPVVAGCPEVVHLCVGLQKLDAEPGPATPGDIELALQRSETPPQDHPRLHLDLDLHVSSAAEQTAEAERLIAIGAERVDWDSYPDDPDFIVLADPDANRFCIVDLSHASD